MTTGKTVALTLQTFVGKVMSLVFNTLYRFSSKSFHIEVYRPHRIGCLFVCFLLCYKANLDILKSRDITLLTKVHLVKSMVFPVVMYGFESWTLKKVEG